MKCATLFARLTIAALFILISQITPKALQAQQSVWLQIEARPTLSEATERAQAYGAIFPQAAGFLLPSGWYAIALGPYGPNEAPGALAALKAEGMIPSDSYLTDGREFRGSFWPPEGVMMGNAVPPDVSSSPLAPEDVPPLPEEQPAEAAPAQRLETTEPVPFDTETLADARRAEAALPPEDKQALQQALQWFGFYQGGIDGAFGPGTRNAMAAWQAAIGLEATGVLSSMQRATLIANYEAEIAEYGFATVEEREAGITATLPLALLEFDRYEPPFVHFRAKSEAEDLRLVLISQPGDAASLKGLYDILQTLNDMPADGPRAITANSFAIEGRSANRVSRAWTKLERGAIKGWMLISTPQAALRDARIIEVLEQSFRVMGDTALDPGMVPLSDAARRGLVAGLEVKRPISASTGFYISADGKILTLAAPLQSCGRITIDRQHDAQIALNDATSGLAVLAPVQKLAPSAFANFQTGPDRIGAEIISSGYSYGERLPAPVLNYGSFEEGQGLDGETGVKRLSLDMRAGDAGGPVFDQSGAVIGMLQAPPASESRVLPAGTAFALGSQAIINALRPSGLALAQSGEAAPLPPETLSRRASAMTVLISCWE